MYIYTRTCACKSTYWLYITRDSIVLTSLTEYLFNVSEHVYLMPYVGPMMAITVPADELAANGANVLKHPQAHCWIHSLCVIFSLSTKDFKSNWGLDAMIACYYIEIVFGSCLLSRMFLIRRHQRKTMTLYYSFMINTCILKLPIRKSHGYVEKTRVVNMFIGWNTRGKWQWCFRLGAFSGAMRT